MLVESNNGNVIGITSRALIIEKPVSLPTKEFANPLPSTIDQYGPIAMWGTNNLLPQEMAADIEKTGVLSAAIDAKARIAVGKGPTLAKRIGVDSQGQEQLEFINDNEVLDWLEMSNAFNYSLATAKDLFGFGNAPTEIVLSNDRKRIMGFKRYDPCMCRLAAKDPKTLRSENVFLSGDWAIYSIPSTDKQTLKENKHIATVPLLDKDFPLIDLQQRTSGTNFMLWMQYALWNRHYYSPSPWYCAKEWVNFNQSIPQMKAAMAKNQLTIKYIIEIHPGFWILYDDSYSTATNDKKKEIRSGFYNELDKYLAGTDNAFKSILSTKVLDPQTNTVVPAIEIKTIDDKIKDGKLLPDGAAADSQILFALSMNPALVGLSIPDSGTPVTAGSGSNIREAFLVQLMLLTCEQYTMATVFNIAKRYHNWDSNYVLRFPNQVLTTLNTGASTQPMA